MALGLFAEPAHGSTLGVGASVGSAAGRRGRSVAGCADRVTAVTGCPSLSRGVPNCGSRSADSPILVEAKAGANRSQTPLSQVGAVDPAVRSSALITPIGRAPGCV